jgi:diguanylate cyclase (GGDEF)-like protein/PAS domain S-box-containing protein
MQEIPSKPISPAIHAMKAAPTSVLLVESDPGDARLILDSLAGAAGRSFRVEWVSLLSAALLSLVREAPEVVLLDLTLSDGQGVEVFDQVFRAAPNSLILVLSQASDEETARQAVRRGAQDYLVKGHVDAHWLPRALRYLIERKAARDALGISEARFRAMSDASPLGIFVSDAEGGCVYTNSAYQKISGLSFEETLGMNWGMAIHPEDRHRVLSEWHASVAERAPFQSEVRFLRKDGSVVWTRINSAPLSEGLAPHGRVKIVEDITERKTTELVLRAAEEALFEEKERAQVTLNSIGDAVLTTDILGRVTYLNQVAETMTGWHRADALGRTLTEVFRIMDATTHAVAGNPVHGAIAHDRIEGLAANSVLVRRDGRESAIEDSVAPIHNRNGEVVGAVIVFHDVSASRAMALKMTHLAQHDFLTDLPNRVLLTERLSQAIRLAYRHRKQVALLFLDLDYFKHINDSLGHSVGDQLLQSVAERLVACVRTTDTVCRQGGDEFVILLAEIERPEDAAGVAEKLLTAFGLPHSISGNELHVTLSIGISVYPADGLNVDDVMQSADTAMYHAKASGRNNYQFFKAEMNTRAVHRLFVESTLRRALRQEEFVLNFQPKINIVSGAMTGAEALIRWQDPDLGLIYPEQFVPIAEECGLIVPIGRWVLHEACRQVRNWLDAGLCAVPVAVNISAVEFRNKGFLEGVGKVLSETGLPPRYLELELTESVLMHDAKATATALEALKAMGVQLAIDDFGTGYSSLSYLSRFPIDTLKIDQSFVRDMARDENNGTIVTAVIAMGRSLKQRVVAEGVETSEQLAFLRSQKCDEAQGFLFSHPLPAEDFGRLLLKTKEVVSA